MALPTAQLGSMASLNVPSYLPKQIVQKQPKLWEQALAQMLVQAAGQVANQGVGNLMSTEHAEEFGKKPNTGVKKFLYGSNVPQAEASRLRAEDSRSALSQFETDSQRVREQAAQDAALERQISGEASADLRQADAQSAARMMEELRNRNEGEREANRAATDLTSKKSFEEFKTGLSSDEEKARAEYYRSQTAAKGAETESAKLGNQLLGSRLPGGDKGGKSTLPGLPPPKTANPQGAPEAAKPATRTGPEWVKYYMKLGLKGRDLEQAVKVRMKESPPVTGIAAQGMTPEEYATAMYELIMKKSEAPTSSFSQTRGFSPMF